MNKPADLIIYDYDGAIAARFPANRAEWQRIGNQLCVIAYGEYHHAYNLDRFSYSVEARRARTGKKNVVR